MDVVLIGGCGRSGSTLLARLLHVADGVVAAGELHELWTLGFQDDARCGCGAVFSRCPFWTRVVEEAFGRAQAFEPGAIRDLSGRLNTTLRKLALQAPWRTAACRRDLRAYGRVLVDLLEAIGRVAGAGIVVDASKTPTHALVLEAALGRRLHLAHLVRDSRGVAYSAAYRPLLRERRGQVERLPARGPILSSLRYYTGNVPFHLLAARGCHYTRMRYEDVVAEPREAVGSLLAFIGGGAGGAPRCPEDLSDLGVVHMLAGNPLRHSRGRVPIRLDDEWRSKLPLGERGLVGFLTAPLLLSYGYAP